MKVTGLGVKPQIDSFSIIPDDVLGTRVMVASSSHQFLHAKHREKSRVLALV